MEDGARAARQREYDGFGPWIMDIDEPDMMPALFRPYYRETETPLMLIRIPGKMDRRAASPMMDLYDYVIGAFEDNLYILKRNGKSVAERRIGYREISAVKRAHAILKGELALYLPGETMGIAYNTVSDDRILKLIRIIQQRQTGTDKAALKFEAMSEDYDPQNHGGLSLYDANLCEKIKTVNPDLMLAAYQPETAVGRYPAKLLHSLLYKRLRMTRSAFLCDGRTLAVIKSDMTARYRTVDRIA